MTVLHTGSNNKFSANWGNIFGKGKKAAEATTDKPATAKAKKKTAAAKKPIASKKAKKGKR